MESRKKLFSSILLAVILPAILLAPFHHHESRVNEECADCAQHNTHWHSGIQDTELCAVCHFLSANWVGEEECEGLISRPASFCRLESPMDSPCSAYTLILSTRAPPAVFC